MPSEDCLQKKKYYHQARWSFTYEYFPSCKVTAKKLANCCRSLFSCCCKITEESYYRLDDLSMEEPDDESLKRSKKPKAVKLRWIDKHNNPELTHWIITDNATKTIEGEKHTHQHHHQRTAGDEKTFDIINSCPFDVDVYLRFGHHESYYLKILRNTSVKFDLKYCNLYWVAYGECEEMEPLCRGTPVEKISTMMYAPWHNLVLHDIIPYTFCNCCSSKFGEHEQNTFCVVPEEFMSSTSTLGDFNMFTCLNCYYRAVFDSHLKHNKAVTVLRRNAWWERGKLVEIGHVNSSKLFKIKLIIQNDLVKLMVRKYLLATENPEKKDEFPPFPLYEEVDEKQD